MKRAFRLPLSLLAMATSAAYAASVTLPADSAVPASSVSQRGFTVRTVQGPDTPPLANNAVRAIRQLNGTLVDETGAPVPNQAIPGPNAGGVYFADMINFERDAAPFDVVDV